MDFSVIFQLRTKKFWWMDVIFYFVISLLVATILCYLIFLIKDGIQRQEIKKEEVALQTVGTGDQKAQEADVITYQKKINDFTSIFENHQFASNAFAFMQTQTMPNVWFEQFGLDRKNGVIQLSGETDDLEGFSRQIANLEKNQYIKDVSGISSSLGDSARTDFTLNLTMDPKIFNYTSDLASVLQTTSSSDQSANQQDQNNPAGNVTGTPQVSSEKLITAFHILLTPEVIGTVDQKNYIITVNVPFGTDVKSLTPAIVFSPSASVLPASNVPQDFTNPVTYTVTAQDGSTQSYKATVIVAPKVSKAVSKARTNALIIIVIVIGVILILGSIAGFIIWKRMASKKSNI